MNIRNKVNYVLLVLVMCFIFVGDVFAADLDLTVTAVADKTVVSNGGEGKITLTVKSDSPVSSCFFNVSYDSTLEEISKTGINGWEIDKNGVGINGFIVEGSLDGELSAGVDILELKYKVNGAGKVTIKTTECASSDEKSGSYEDIVVNFELEDLSDVTTLSSITVTNGVITNFTPENYSPFITLTNPVFGLGFTTTNPDYQDFVVVTDVDENNISDFSNITYNDANGDGLMTLYVSVNNGRKYELAIKYENRDLDGSLTSLKVNGKNINLVEGQYDYSVTVGKDVSSVIILAELADSENFQFAPGFAPTTHLLSNNVTTISLIVEPKDKSSGTKSSIYILEIIKEGTSSSQSSSKPTTSVPSSKPNSSANATTNPQTGNIFMFVMVIVLLASLLGSVVLYKKNLEVNK